MCLCFPCRTAPSVPAPALPVGQRQSSTPAPQELSAVCYLYLPALIFTCHFVTKGLETTDNKQGARKMPFFTASCFATCFWSCPSCCRALVSALPKGSTCPWGENVPMARSLLGVAAPSTVRGWWKAGVEPAQCSWRRWLSDNVLHSDAFRMAKLLPILCLLPA